MGQDFLRARNCYLQAHSLDPSSTIYGGACLQMQRAAEPQLQTELRLLWRAWLRSRAVA